METDAKNSGQSDSSYNLKIGLVLDQSSFGLKLASLLGLEKKLKPYMCDELKITDTDYLETVSESSPYDPLKGTPYESREEILVPSPVTSYVKRNEVYNSLKTLAKPDRLDQLVAELDKKFPEKLWEDNFPGLETLQYLFNEKKDFFKN
ncbi:Uncharacterised protein [uncultured archaeon]|nr:Uncharacterised protein [uncultured archaeon]